MNSYYDSLDTLQAAIKSFSIENAEAVKVLIRNPDLEREFLGRLSSVDWFEWLLEHGYFDPSRIEFDSSGNASFWNILRYLERVSEQVAESPGPNKEYGKGLLNIIRDIVRFSREQRTVNNPHIWWYCVKIVNNLPSSMIKENVSVEDQADGSSTRYGFRTWLLTWTDPAVAGDLAVTDVAEKLLPKFLEDESTLEYAEVVVAVITRIKASGKKSSLDGRDDAILVCDSYWVADAFQKYHERIGAKCTAGLVYSIADKLERALEYKRQDFAVNIRVGEDIYELGVARVALGNLGPGEIGFKSDAYQSILKWYAPEQIKGLDLKQNFLALWKIEPEIPVTAFAVEAATRDEFVSRARGSLPTSISWNLADELEKNLSALFDGLYEDYSSVWCRSLENGPEHKHDAEGILTVVVRDLVLARCDKKREEGRKILGDFLEERYRFPIFRKLVLLCTDRNWGDYSGLFEQFLEMNPSVFQDSDYEVELQDALRHHWREISPPLLERLKVLIESVPEYYAKEGEQAVAQWKYKWLSPLKDHPDFSGTYNEAKQKVKPKGDKPYEPDRSAFKGGIVGHKSPVSQVEILKMLAAGELVQYLNGFQGADSWHGTFEGEPDKEGLAGELQAAVRAEPRKFIEVLETFHQVGYFYVNTILVGLRAAWNEGKALDSGDWGKILEFCLKYLSRDKEAFRKEALAAQGEDSGGGRYLYVVETVVEFIADGCRDDKKAFDPRHFDAAGKIFDAVLPLLKSEKCSDVQRDALTYALNTTPGKTIRAYVSFSLRVARATGARQENWGPSRYEQFFSAGLVEAPIWFGCYLPNMRYLDEGYTLNRVRALTERPADDCEWRKFMEGYLSGSQIDGKLYALMRPHYMKALQGKGFEGNVEERFVDHLCIGYLWGLELLQQSNSDGQPSLFWKMLDEANTPERRGRWVEVAEHFWRCTSQRVKKEGKDVEEGPTEDARRKILEFWAWTYKEQEFVKTRLGDEYGRFLGQMAYLTILLDRIDEEREGWLLLSAPHIDEHHGSSFFLEYLTKFEDEGSIKRLGRIYRKVLERTTPTFEQENVQLIVEKLYKVGQNDSAVRKDADEICDTYGRRGFHFLKPTWDKHRG